MSATSQPAASTEHCPQRITVAQLISSRYAPTHERPELWAERVAGRDVVRSVDGREYALISDGGQSPPQAGWQILLRCGTPAQGFEWTLVAMPKGCELASAQQR